MPVIKLGVGRYSEHGSELLAGVLAVEPDDLDGVPVDVGADSGQNCASWENLPARCRSARPIRAWFSILRKLNTIDWQA